MADKDSTTVSTRWKYGFIAVVIFVAAILLIAIFNIIFGTDQSGGGPATF